MSSTSNPLCFDNGGNQHTRYVCSKPSLSAKFSLNQGPPADDLPQTNQQQLESKGCWSKWKARLFLFDFSLKLNSAEMSSKLAKLGLAAVLAYVLFDEVTYTTFFIMAFLGYEKGTGKNPAANLQALLGTVILMWAGNNSH